MNPTIRAALWMIGAIVSFTSMAIAGREVSIDLDTFEIMMYRSLVGVIIVVTFASAFGTLGQITRRHMGVHLTRNLFHFSGQNLWFYAITVIPLAQVFALEFTMPLWAILLSALILGEALTRVRMATAVVGFLGILLVTRPSAETLNFGVLCAALAAIGFAGAAVFTRKLTRTETITCILFYLTVMQLVFGLICAGYDGDIAVPSRNSLPYVLVIALAGLVAHFCITKALSLAPAAIVTPIDFARLPIIALVGVLLYNEPLDAWVLVGAIIIFAANYINIWHETRNTHAATKM